MKGKLNKHIQLYCIYCFQCTGFLPEDPSSHLVAFLNAGLLAMNSLTFHLSENVFVSPSFCKCFDGETVYLRLKAHISMFSLISFYIGVYSCDYHSNEDINISATPKLPPRLLVIGSLPVSPRLGNH